MENRDAELELVEAAYGTSFKLVEKSISGPAIFIIELLAAVTVHLTITLPAQFPENPLCCYVDGAIPNSIRNELKDVIASAIEENTVIGTMEVCQIASDYLEEWKNETEKMSTTDNNPEEKRKSVSIARFLIFFHHIMSETKRKALVENAVELKLGGASKHGFPGVVIVEGDLESVLEYVKRIQRLRWQHMVVRGEEIEQLPDQSYSVDQYRKIPEKFKEISTDMSELGSLCKTWDLHELFMTALKKKG